jgi:Uma2 family endonuclease
MTTIAEVEKASVSTLARKKFRTDEIYKMVEAGILPEESGWELIDGEIIHRMSIGSRHAGVVRKLSKILERKYGDAALISGQNPIHIDEHNEPEPDIALLKPHEDFYINSHPTSKDVLLLVEVSDSTLEYDREIKKSLYAKAGIFEFWLVNLQNNTLEVYSQPKNENYYLARILESGEKVESGTFENLTIEIDDILGL